MAAFSDKSYIFKRNILYRKFIWLRFIKQEVRIFSQFSFKSLKASCLNIVWAYFSHAVPLLLLLNPILWFWFKMKLKLTSVSLTIWRLLQITLLLKNCIIIYKQAFFPNSNNNQLLIGCQTRFQFSIYWFFYHMKIIWLQENGETSCHQKRYSPTF